MPKNTVSEIKNQRTVRSKKVSEDSKVIKKVAIKRTDVKAKAKQPQAQFGSKLQKKRLTEPKKNSGKSSSPKTVDATPKKQLAKRMARTMSPEKSAIVLKKKPSTNSPAKSKVTSKVSETSKKEKSPVKGKVDAKKAKPSGSPAKKDNKSSSPQKTVSQDKKLKTEAKPKTLKLVEVPSKVNSVMPKRAATGYMQYNRQMCKGSSGKPISELTKENGAKWNAMSLTQRAPFMKLGEVEKVRYHKEMDDFKKNGFFINQNGVNSKKLFLQEVAKKTQVKPKNPMSAYFFFNIESYHKTRKEKPDMQVTEIYKQNGLSWKSLDEKKKEPYNKLASQDVVRHKTEMKQLETQGYFINKDGVKSTDTMVKGFVDILRKDFDNIPKQPKSIYSFFVKENVPKVIERKGFSQKEAINICAQMWGEISENGKEKYKSMHDKDQKRYEKQLFELQKKGFYTLENGSKSTDDTNKILKKRKMPVQNQESEKTLKNQKSQKKQKQQ